MELTVADAAKLVHEYGGPSRSGWSPATRDVYRALGLPFIHLDFRESRGEIDLALKGNLPKLIADKDLRGNLHCHNSAKLRRRRARGSDSRNVRTVASRILQGAVSCGASFRSPFNQVLRFCTAFGCNNSGTDTPKA